MAKRKQKISRAPTKPPAAVPYTCPAVSVVIPLYNAEKYIGECLDSILAQTFQNFEVIVVDDCSTDGSVAIVQSYAEKFGGRLTLSSTEKNSGGGGYVPRNKGIAFSRGEYIFCVDADDTITPTAFEELYTLAKEYDADVVACESYYNVPENLWYDADFRAQLEPFSYKKIELVDKPTVISSDLAERVEDICDKKFLWNLWSKLIRRNLILENEISFAKRINGDDMLFTICLLCAAEKVIRVPNVINYYRVLENSLSHVKKEPRQHFVKYIRSWTVGFRYLDEFFSRREFFKQNPHLRYLLLEAHMNTILNYILSVYTEVSVLDLDEILQKEFGRGDNSALAAFVYNVANIHRLQLKEQFDQFNEYVAQTQARIAQLEAELKRKN